MSRRFRVAARGVIASMVLAGGLALTGCGDDGLGCTKSPDQQAHSGTNSDKVPICSDGNYPPF
jgi:hypothetical protein